MRYSGAYSRKLGSIQIYILRAPPQVLILSRKGTKRGRVTNRVIINIIPRYKLSVPIRRTNKKLHVYVGGENGDG